MNEYLCKSFFLQSFHTSGFSARILYVQTECVVRIRWVFKRATKIPLCEYALFILINNIIEKSSWKLLVK